MGQNAETISQLRELVGRKGLVQIKSGLEKPQEISFTILEVAAPADKELGDDLERAIEWSAFTVRLDDGVMLDVDGSGSKSVIVLPGHGIYWRL